MPDEWAWRRLTPASDLTTLPAHLGLCLRSSARETTAINTSLLRVDLLHSAGWCRGNYPGWVIVLFSMIKLVSKVRKNERGAEFCRVRGFLSTVKDINGGELKEVLSLVFL
jgi:hypothetical protein